MSAIGRSDGPSFPMEEPAAGELARGYVSEAVEAGRAEVIRRAFVPEKTVQSLLYGARGVGILLGGVLPDIADLVLLPYLLMKTRNPAGAALHGVTSGFGRP